MPLSLCSAFSAYETAAQDIMYWSPSEENPKWNQGRTEHTQQRARGAAIWSWEMSAALINHHQAQTAVTEGTSV